MQSAHNVPHISSHALEADVIAGQPHLHKLFYADRDCAILVGRCSDQLNVSNAQDRSVCCISNDVDELCNRSAWKAWSVCTHQKASANGHCADGHHTVQPSK